MEKFVIKDSKIILLDGESEIGFRDSKFYSLTEEEKKKFIKELDRKECKVLYDDYMKIENKKNY